MSALAEDAEIVEAVARAIMESMAQQHVTDDQWATALQSGEDADTLLTWATAALSAARPLIERAARKEALEEAEMLREAIRRALSCTPSIGTSEDGYFIQYDCGDPWEILRQALDEGGGK